MSLSSSEHAVGSGGCGLRVTHQQIFAITSFLAFHRGAMDVGDHGVSARNVALKFRNDGTGFHDVATHVGNGLMRAPRQRRRRLSRRTWFGCQIPVAFVAKIADLA